MAKLQIAESGSTAKAEVQVARMVVIMVMAFLLTWLPYAAFALTVIIDSNIHINPIIASIPAYLTKTSTVFNPIIYIFMNRQVSRKNHHIFLNILCICAVVLFNKIEKFEVLNVCKNMIIINL